ncbi:4'-phosphopantetheinyl transferase family protein [Cupriavidus sp. TMH.W2]|uniref:4'-phosphopantetheinyl transferase family protein n=1 Tax=Cupriavidus sp. TMH.W2 TaxID=3434465 RepID=UPI003D76F2C0
MPAWLRLGCVTALAAQAPEAQSWMSAGERARLAAMPATRRRGQFVAGRWLARTLLAQAFGGSWQDWSLTDGEDAPPQARGPAPASLSISHSGDRIACAVGTNALGLDLEFVRPRKGLDALYGAVTTEAERATLASHVAPGDIAHRFAHAWTLKEAGLKLHGGGLFATMLGHALTLEASCAQGANACTWLHDGHVLALCAPDIGTLTTLVMPAAPRYWRLVPTGSTAINHA